MMEGDKYDDDSEEVVEMMGIVGGSCNNSSTSGGGGSSSRWNPTKEQIRMLENLYKEGIRTPTAEEIQHITARLRVYGHIEGKNVFYWFQNHKARQRQKQKQHSIAYFNRFLNHPHHPLFTSTPPNNPMCGPYCMAQQGQSTEMGFYHHHQHPKVLVPVGISRRNNNNPNNEKVVVPMGMMPPRSTMCAPNNAPVVSVSVPVPVPVPLVYEGAMIQQMQQQQQQQTIISDCNNLSNQETLDLFPLHPTGILGGKPTEDNNNNKVVLVVSPDHHHQYGYGNQNQKPSFFDFFTSRATSD